MPVTPDDLVSTRQIAALLGVTSATVSNYKQRYADFPRPWWSDGRQGAYLTWQVLAWARHHGLPGKGPNRTP